MSSKLAQLLVGAIVVASAGLMLAPEGAKALASRQVSSVEWFNWERLDAFDEGRFGKAYSVGMVELPRSGSMFFMIYQVRNVSPVIVDAKCEVKAMSTGEVVYAIDQRLKPNEISDTSGAGVMASSETGEKFAVSCHVGIPML